MGSFRGKEVVIRTLHIGRIKRVLQLVLLASMAQNPAPSIEPMSFYGMRTYANQANFGFLSESWHLVMAPASYESMTFHLKKGDQELVTYGHYFDDTPWPAFRLARLQYPAPIWLEQEGEYVAEYRLDGKVISAFPFTITPSRSRSPRNRAGTPITPPPRGRSRLRLTGWGSSTWIRPAMGRP